MKQRQRLDIKGWFGGQISDTLRLMPQSRSAIIRVPGFSNEAPRLRKHFEKRFSNPRDTRADRFIWDYWHVPNQYTALRTPAYEFFPKAIYRPFHEKLVQWGRTHLGCHDVSPPWMSLYIDGFHQALHADVPHGPWAYVFSLTPWKKRKFSGGETILLKDEILNYWTKGAFACESDAIFDKVAPEFNQLTVFDPRIPHGVNRVEGAHDPRDGRLVIHGWFVNPRPFIEGPLSEGHLQEAIDGLIEHFDRHSIVAEATRGILSLNFKVNASGVCSNLKVLSNTLRGLPGVETNIARAMSAFFKNYRFRRLRKSSQVTLPLIFE